VRAARIDSGGEARLTREHELAGVSPRKAGERSVMGSIEARFVLRLIISVATPLS
jgi:hypothetical protein